MENRLKGVEGNTQDTKSNEMEFIEKSMLTGTFSDNLNENEILSEIRIFLSSTFKGDRPQLLC